MKNQDNWTQFEGRENEPWYTCSVCGKSCNVFLDEIIVVWYAEIINEKEYFRLTKCICRKCETKIKNEEKK